MSANRIKFLGILIVLVGVFFIGRHYYFIERNKTFIDVVQISEEERQALRQQSNSQIDQDIFAYLASDKKTGGFFVDFGATDGVRINNSFMLETNHGWRGILAEPARVWHKALKQNRPQASIETDCVWSKTGEELTFYETGDAEFSTIDSYVNADDHSQIRTERKSYKVKTISLVDMLDKHQAPDEIDYLSIDTEGSEYEILEAFFKDNSKYKIRIITCEHNYTDNRQKIYDLLTKHGYVRQFKNVSHWDDFYVLKD